jgi:hypothetical protein
LVRDKNVSWSLLYRIEHVLSQSVYHATSKSCMIQSNITVYTVFFGLWYKYHDMVSWYLLYRITGALGISNLHICGPSSIIIIVKMKYKRTDVIWWLVSTSFKLNLGIHSPLYVHDLLLQHYFTQVYIYSCSS